MKLTIYRWTLTRAGSGKPLLPELNLKVRSICRPFEGERRTEIVYVVVGEVEIATSEVGRIKK